MAVCLINKSGGGITSDDVTAGKAQVLQGYRTITSDSNDEVAEGEIENRGNIVDTVSFENAYWDLKFLARIEQGFYSQNGQWKPCVAIPYAVMANVAGVDANKMLDSLTIAGVRGTVHTYGAWNNASEVVNATWENKVHVRFEEGYYPKDGNYKPAAIVPYDVLANAIGIDASKMLNSLSVLGKRGQIKTVDTAESNYRINKSTSFGIDNWTNPSNPVFYVDFPHGSAYYTRPDGHPHVCIDAVNLGDVTPDKVMRGFTATSKNGVRFAGTMSDYSSGRVVFNGATFDNVLVSGVAAKNFYFNRELYSYIIANGYGYAGIYGGGMNLSLRTTSPELRGRKIGCILSQSNNLTPFRRIVVDYRTTGSISGNPTISFYAFIAPSRALVREGVEFNGARVDGFSQMSVQVMASERQGQLVIDISNINEQAFLGFYASANASGAESFSGTIQITKIEFFN